jgi:hypothetical protein
MTYYETEHLDDFVDNSKYNLLNEAKNLDKGHARIWGFSERPDGSLKEAKIDIYTTGYVGTHIRDAESGEYYREVVGSLDEELYFKMAMSTGHLKAKNESNILFYKSPDHCMRHLHIDISPEIVSKWQVKRDHRLATRRRQSEKKGGNIIVK